MKGDVALSVTVYTTTGNTWTLSNGTAVQATEAPTGELFADVLDAAGNWIGAFGSVEAVYLNGSAVLTVAAASRSAL